MDALNEDSIRELEGAFTKMPTAEDLNALPAFMAIQSHQSQWNYFRQKVFMNRLRTIFIKYHYNQLDRWASYAIALAETNGH